MKKISVVSCPFSASTNWEMASKIADEIAQRSLHGDSSRLDKVVASSHLSILCVCALETISVQKDAAQETRCSSQSARLKQKVHDIAVSVAHWLPFGGRTAFGLIITDVEKRFEVRDQDCIVCSIIMYCIVGGNIWKCPVFFQILE